MTARIIDGMPAAEYHADPCERPSLSAGIAKVLLAKSPAAAWHIHPRLNPDYVDEDSSKFDLGTTAHALLLEGTEDGLVVVEADDWRTKAAQARREEAHAAGKTALLARQADAVRGMVSAAQDFIAGSEIAAEWPEAKSEQTILWQEEGVHLRVRPDRLTHDRKVCLDYKTTGDASPEVFIRQIATLGYHVQASLYRRGVRALGYEDPHFVFLAQEIEAPYECALYACDPEMRAIGDTSVERAIGMWREALTKDYWPGYGTRVMWAAPPAWLSYRDERFGHG